ncbi:uncharacterized protein LOC110720528 [Chenopodium quinoa]|uniref:uncharacterized protein LOC110720528 n=1 Tax=Chenopodium quinoa TaxID=63459 RepID=UPI000B78C3EB|nr:uncharacterized protein LOC110720528 [Chenopodium quinoa]
MNGTEEEVVDIIEDIVRYYRDWQDGERDSTSKISSSVYSVDHLNAINNLSSQMTNLGKEMIAIKEKLEISSSEASNLPSQFKGRDHASPSSLPSQGIYPKRLVNAIVTRSGKVLEQSLTRNNETKEVPKKVLVEDERDGSSLSEVVIKTPSEVRVEKEIVKPKLPYPQRFMRHMLDEQFGRFIDMLKKLHLSLPCTEVVIQMPNYAKFLKGILNGKRTCDVVETVNLTKNCSAIIMNKIPPKLKDPKNFSIPCAINKMLIDNALCDRSIKFPNGKVEDVPLRVGKFVTMVDFVVLEMDEDATIPIILGRPFLSTSGAMIDVKSACKSFI